MGESTIPSPERSIELREKGELLALVEKYFTDSSTFHTVGDIEKAIRTEEDKIKNAERGTDIMRQIEHDTKPKEDHRPAEKRRAELFSNPLFRHEVHLDVFKRLLRKYTQDDSESIDSLRERLQRDVR